MGLLGPLLATFCGSAPLSYVYIVTSHIFTGVQSQTKGFRMFFYRLALLLLLLLPSWATAQPPASATKGLLDLRSSDWQAAGIPLVGEWEFYWQTLANNNAQLPPQPTIYSRLPQLWKDISLNGQPLPSQGYATYRLRILLPKPFTAPAALLVPDFYSAYKLFANGRLVAQDGEVGTDAQHSRPHWSSQVVEMPAVGDTLELILQVCNFVHSKGGCTKAIRLGSHPNLHNKLQRYMALDIFVGGCLFMGAILFLGLFMFNRSEKTILYFALFCLMYSYRIVGTEIYTLHNLLPSLDFYLTLRLEYMTLCLAVSFFILYVRQLYPAEGSSKIAFILLTLTLAYTAMSLVAPPLVYTAFINYFLILLLFYIAYAIFIFVKAWRNNRPGAQYGIWSCAVIVVLFLLSIASYFGIVPMYKTTELFGYIAFFYLQSLILSYRSSYRLNKAKEAAEKGLQAKTQFLSTMSHEIRTPLNAVIGIAQLLQKDDHNLTAQQKEYVEALEFSGNNLLAIVNDILDYGKIDANKLQLENLPMNLKEIAARVMAGFKKAAADKQIDLLSEVDNGIPHWVMGDPIRTSQVLFNLLSNAIKFTKKGHVKLRLQQLPTATDGQCKVLLSVEDTGIGISPEKLQLIFEPFTQADSSTSRSYGGTGLGLAICKNILEMQGLSLQVSSEKDKGSVFSFIQTFAVANPAVNVAVAPQLENAPSFAGKSILLVEDNAMNVMIAKHLLQQWGIDTEVAMNGQDALDKFDARRHHLVLMDLHMPVMDGYEAARHIRSQNTTIPIVALTANVADDVAEEVQRSGIDTVVTKPFKQHELKEVLAKYLR
jgi:signal transduction histidine kinase